MRRMAPLVLILLLASSAPAFADLTGFLGRAASPVRPLEGFSIGTGLVIVAFEFEFARTSEALTPPTGPAGPALQTYMFNGLLQTPFPIARMQFYGTVGGGLYHETLSTDPINDQWNFGTNVGGGAKIGLIGPLRLRVDYRVFTLKGNPRQATVQRLYAGINLKF